MTIPWKSQIPVQQRKASWGLGTRWIARLFTHWLISSYQAPYSFSLDKLEVLVLCVLWWMHEEKRCLYYQKCRVSECWCMSTPVSLAGDAGLPHCPVSGQSVWAGLWGSSLLWATDFYEKRMFASLCVCVCVCVCVTIFIRPVVGPRASFSIGKAEGDTRMLLVSASTVCVWTSRDPISPQQTL